MGKIIYHPIGIIRTPFKPGDKVPVQPKFAEGTEGEIEIFPEYVQGLKDIEKFSHIILIYHFHLCHGYKLLVKPFFDDKIRGVFSTISPHRPNPIGISIVRLKEVKNNIIKVSDVDIIDKTPLLDIKPYVPVFDRRKNVKIGWLENKLRF